MYLSTQGDSVAETSNVAKMAEILALKLFARFLWNETGGWDQNWSCVKDEHVVRKKKTSPRKGAATADANQSSGTANAASTNASNPEAESAEYTKLLTHPSDVVFYYDEPYSLSRTYVNTDLKSYKKGSITSHSVASAIESLALTLECAEVSFEWREKYVHEEKNYRIVGMLFIYNHDGEYDKGFDEILAKINHEKLRIPQQSTIFVLGPRDIRWLDNVRIDMQLLYSDHVIPHEDNWVFHYPDLVRKKKVQVSARAATLEMLTGPWIILSYPATKQNPPGYIVYFRGSGKYTEEFLYLLDYLMHYQMVKQGIAIQIRTFDTAENAHALFNRAVDEYIENYEGQESDFAANLRAIKFELMEQIQSQFSTLNIGMKRG